MRFRISDCDVDVYQSGLPGNRERGKRVVRVRHRITARVVDREVDERLGGVAVGDARQRALAELHRQVEAEQGRVNGYKRAFGATILRVCAGVQIDENIPGEEGLTRVTIPRRNRTIFDTAVTNVRARAWLAGPDAGVSRVSDDEVVFVSPGQRVEVRVVD